MIKEKTLTVEELFFLGRAVKGPFIDYAYIASMDDIQKDFSGHEQKNYYSLQNKGILTEDFFGEITLSEEWKKYEPIFFGDAEGRIEVCGPAGETKLLDMRLHFYKDKVLMTSLEGKLVNCWSLNITEISQVLRGIINIGSSEQCQNREVNLKDADKVYVVTYGKNNVGSKALVWYESNDSLFQKFASGEIFYNSIEEFYNKIENLLKGGEL